MIKNPDDTYAVAVVIPRAKVVRRNKREYWLVDVDHNLPLYVEKDAIRFKLRAIIKVFKKLTDEELKRRTFNLKYPITDLYDPEIT
jgi:hypothetical protein